MKELKNRKVKQVVSDIYQDKIKFTINCELVDRSHAWSITGFPFLSFKSGHIHILITAFLSQ